MNIFQFLADTVALLHFFWIIIFIIFGFLSLKDKNYQKFYRIIFVATFGSQVIFLGCPLTFLESFFRLQHNPEIEEIKNFILYHLEIELSFVETITVIVLVAIVFIIKHEERLEEKLNTTIKATY
jgi:hypothetical protein